MKKSTTLLIVSLMLASAASLPDTFILPHVLEKSGSINGVVWNPTGGHPSIAIDEGGAPRVKRKPTTFLVSLYDNQDFYSWMIACVSGRTSSTSYAMYSTQKGARTSVQSNITLDGVQSVTFPACDIESKEPAGVEVEVLVSKVETVAAEPPPGAKELVKRQKLWLPSNFRFSIDGKSSQEVNKISSITLRMVHADLDGDGTLELVQELSDFHFTTSSAARAPFDEEFRKAVEGSPVVHTATLQYLDDDGLPLLTLSFPFSVVGVSPENTFGDPTDPAPPVRVSCEGKPPRGTHVTVLK